MITAAASVNWSYVAILVVPSLLVLVFMALTWRSRARRQHEEEEKRRLKEAARSSGPSRRGDRRRRRK